MDMALYKDADVPGYVKLVFALRDAGRDLARPVVSAIVTLSALWMVYQGVPMPDWMAAVMTAFFPAWASSRAAEKLTTIVRGQ